MDNSSDRPAVRVLSPLVLWAGRQVWPEGRTGQDPDARAYRVFTVESGRLEMTVDDYAMELGPGSSVLLPPRLRARRTARTGVRMGVVRFLLDAGGRGDGAEQPSPMDLWHLHLPLEVPPPFAPRFKEVAADVVDKYHSALPVRRCQAGLLIGELCANYAGWFLEYGGYRRLRLEDRLRHAESVARRSLDAGMDVRAFAAAAGLKPSRFHAVYRHHRGVTPNTFLRGIRMETARHLLADTDHAIAAIARRTGYADATAFGRAFRVVHATSPATYRATRRSGRTPSHRSDERL